MDSSSPPPSSSSSSSSSSLVSRAKTALHSAATRAEKVITDIKADLKNDRDRGDGQSQKLGRKDVGEQPVASRGSEDPGTTLEEFHQQPKHSKWKPINLGKKQDWQQSLKNLRIGKKDAEEEKFDKATSDNSVAADNFQQKQGDTPGIKERSSTQKEEDNSNLQKTSLIPSASVLKNLAAAIESGRNLNSVKDLLALDSNSPPTKERSGLSFSVVKSLVLREKEKLNSENCGDMEISSIVRLLFDSEEVSAERKNGSRSQTFSMTYVRGAPPESFLVKVSEITGSFKSLQKMMSFWHNVVAELRRLWSEGKSIPHVPLDENPDLDCCLLHQQLQVINCCIARKLRRTIAMESLDSVVNTSPYENSVGFVDKLSVNPIIYARIRTGDHVLRLGANRPSKNLTMLETDEPIYSPVTQEGPVLTEELIRETEEFVLRTGSIGAGCSQLLSDMQAFKAANPGCILEDFIRWYSPPDWKEGQLDFETACEGDGSSKKGCLSRRMQKEGNLWRELWEGAKPLPAARQAPLFDEDLAVESILTSLEDMPPSELLEQIFLSLLCSGVAVAECTLSVDSNFSKLFNDCKEYVIAACQSSLSRDSISDLCKVYETIETILRHPEDATWVSEERSSEEPKSRLKKLRLPFVSKDKLLLPKRPAKDRKKPDDKNIRMFSNLFDGKTSLFTKKNSQPNLPATTQANLDENDWTIV